MNSIKLLLSLTIILSFICSRAQVEAYYSSYNWDPEPNYNVSFSDSIHIVTYKENIAVEFIIENDRLFEVFTEHKIIWVNSDEEIEKNNKIYLPFSETAELLVNKARVISKSGNITELDESNIFTAEDEETEKVYKYFTFEGIEKGSFIEYFFVSKKYPNYKGRRRNLQTEHTKYDAQFNLFAPLGLYFEFKSYNGLEAVVQDTNTTDKLHWVLHIDSIPKLEKEDQSAYYAHIMYLIYKLDRNLNSGSYDISSYGEVAKNIYNFLYDDETKSEIKNLTKFINTIGIDKNDSLYKKIRQIEDHIKKTIFMIGSNTADLSDIGFILNYNVASKNGLIKLYARIFNILEIENQFVTTCDRMDMKFDQGFEANNFLSEDMFYFPEIDSYLSHSDLSSRLGFPPPLLTNNYGLFIKEISLGDFKTGIGKIKFIEANSYDKSFDNMLIDIKFDENDLSKIEIKLDKATGGYYAMYFHPYYDLLDKKTQDELIENLIKLIGEDIEIIDQQVYNEDPSMFGIKPFRIVANVDYNTFIETAGNKYLFKIGELIGPQLEMYQKKERVLPVESEFNRNYHRVITFDIPEGFDINNLDDLNIENYYEKDGETLLAFSSFYVQEGNKITVTADEYYKIIEIEPELFDVYRKVINSAADFNKVTLILEPK